MSQRPVRLLLLCTILLPLLGCQAFTKSAADREVYGALAGRRARVPELVGSLHIEAEDRIAEALRDRKAYLLDIEDAVALAMLASRDFRRQRETVYLTALDYTFQRHQFAPLFGGGGGADIEFDADGTVVGGGADWQVTRAFETGGSIALGLATTLLSNLTGNPLRTAQTLIDLDVVLPLVRGSGRLVTLEPLRQAERDMLYALRDFARTQQELRVDIASRVYGALRLLDTYENEERAYESLEGLVAEQGFRAEAGEIAEFQLDQARQDLLASDDRRLRAQRRYQDALDQLKLDLGIPVDVVLELDPSDLAKLRESGPVAPAMEEVKALPTAAKRRLDLLTIRDEEHDAIRQIAISKDALRVSLGLTGNGSLNTDPERPFDLKGADPSGSWGLDLDLPLERTAERNAHVRAVISAMRARRARQQLEDLVAFQVRSSFRRLREARRSYEIQVEGVRLSERRVESTSLLLQEGSANIRDRLEAEDARVQAANRLTSALVDYAIALLEMERDTGVLAVVPPPASFQPGFPPMQESAPDDG